MHLALIADGTVIQEKSVEGEEVWGLQGAPEFLPNGLKWVEHRFGIVSRPYKLEKLPQSSRGALSIERLARKTQTSVEGRVFQALRDAQWSDHTGQTYSFSTVETEQDILQAVLPDGKFTDYLFNRDHPRGGDKAQFIIDELGFDPEDWRFLAAQFYDGLLLSKPRDLKLSRWGQGYGAQFNVLVEITSRAGKSGVMRTGWMLQPQKLPSLSTALPDHDGEGVVKPPVPPILPPRERDDDWWQVLFTLANERGRLAHEEVLPTPMYLAEFGIIEEGECGSAVVNVPDARRGFARWLIKSGNGDSGYKGGAAVYCDIPSQSLDRAKAYATAFARVLALNGITSRIETYYT